MYDFLIGLSFEEAVEELEARGISYYYESETIEEAIEEEDELLVGGGPYSEIVWLPYFDADGVIVSVEESFWCID